ncbi:MAG: hypothetical protein A2176_05015 [Spirochaetes bacterium RBG_13_51_14]|nr:MAG: hypothetical protein A2176_05015 [Spirochaetes bacterium RBG_13_51_14]
MARMAVIFMPLFLLTQCFQISHILDWKDDGTMNVRWMFRFSKALDQAQQGQKGDEKKSKSLGELMEKEKKELPDTLKGLVKNLNFKNIENDFDSGIEISFLVPDYAKFPFDKIKKEDFPLIPQYQPEKKQVVFHFEPVKKPGEQKKDEKGKEGVKAETPADGSTAGDQSMEQMGKQITQLFLSSVRYQIFLGKKFNPDKVVIKKNKEEKKVDMLRIGELTIIDLPLFALYGEKEEAFDMIVFLK